MAVTDEAIDKIKGMLLRGELTPGSRLPPEKDLAERLGLSRSSLREAVKALEVIRVLDVRRGDGTFVTSLEPRLLLEAVSFVVDLHDDDSLLEVFSVRRVLESHATGLAAQWASDDEVRELEAEITAVEACTDIELLVEHDVRFHATIARTARNDYLASLLESLTSKTLRARLWRGLTQAGSIERTISEHRAMLDAIRARDVRLASSAAEVHVAGIENWLRETRSRS